MISVGWSSGTKRVRLMHPNLLPSLRPSPGISRTTANVLAPKVVWVVLCGELAATFTSQAIELPVFHEVMRERDRLESLETAEVATDSDAD